MPRKRIGQYFTGVILTIVVRWVKLTVEFFMRAEGQKHGGPENFSVNWRLESSSKVKELEMGGETKGKKKPNSQENMNNALID